MPIQVTQTKVILPRRRSDLLTRQRLIDLMFDLMDYKLAILVAPAGYGKTSLLVDFAHHSDLSICWYSVDALSHDIARFIAHFIAAISHTYPQFGKYSLAALEENLQGRFNLDNLVATIVNEAYEHIREHFVFIIDDYHLVHDQKEINYFISRFTQEVDENCHMILSSRALLTLPDMPLMVARSMVGGLSLEELAFQADEIQALMMEKYHLVLSRADAEELYLATEGWVTGLLLSSENFNSGYLSRLRAARISRVGLNDYLVQQILDQQPSEVRNFLLKTSLLEEFDLKFCQAVLGKDSSFSDLFDYVLKNNLFVLPVGQDGKWIRYHHLFRDFLQERLEEENPLAKVAIQQQLLRVYSQREDWEKAFAISRHLDAHSQIDIILQAGPSLVKNGRLALLADWIDQLPSADFHANPHLLSLRAVPEIMSGKIESGYDMLNRAVELHRSLPDPAGLAKTLSRRATALRFMGKYWEALEDATEANQLIGNDPSLLPFQADALRAAGISLYQIGKIPESIEKFNQSLDIYRALNEPQNIATIVMELGLVLMGTGRYRQALDYYQQSLEYWREVNDTVRMANLLNNLGVLYHLIGDYEHAASTFEEALLRARQNRYARMEAYILSSIGDLYSDLEANRAALEAYRKSHDIARNIDYPFLILYTSIAAASRFRSIGNLLQAEQYLETAEGWVSDKSSHFEQGLYQLEKGRLLQAKGELSAALEWIESAVEHLDESGQPVETARGRMHLANTYYQANYLEAAFQELQQSLSLIENLDSQHILVICGLEAKNLLQAAENSGGEVARPVTLLLKTIRQFENDIASIRKNLRPKASTIPFAPPRLVITSLGKGKVERDGKTVDIPEWQNQRKVREIFYYLLTQPQGKLKEEIGLIFWPDSSASQLKLQFKNAIYRLRHALGPDVVQFKGDLYTFNRDQDYEYDVEHFLKLVDEARELEDTEIKISKYLTALKIYSGPYLPEAEGGWATAERERLKTIYIQAILEVGELYFEKKDYIAALEWCQSALDEEPYMEEGHRLAMRIHGARGNRAGVSRQFEQCKYLLKKEIDAAPSSETLLLYEKLIS
jgi:ATP/maltotriose-dependent transcriptional regulator MalT/DNA-binding SARP family transcriptional activator